jgi:hypothetical protein
MEPTEEAIVAMEAAVDAALGLQPYSFGGRKTFAKNIIEHLPPSFCFGSEYLELESEYARLRRIEEARDQCSGSPEHYGGCGCLCHGDYIIETHYTATDAFPGIEKSGINENG